MADYMNQNAVVPSAVGGGQQLTQAPGAASMNLDDLTEAELEELLSKMTADYEGQENTLDEQMASAEALRGQSGAQGRKIGRMYLAANPLEHLASGVRSGMGSFEARDARQGREALGQDKQSALATMMRRSMGR